MLVAKWSNMSLRFARFIAFLNCFLAVFENTDVWNLPKQCDINKTSHILQEEANKKKYIYIWKNHIACEYKYMFIKDQNIYQRCWNYMKTTLANSDELKSSKT